MPYLYWLFGLSLIIPVWAGSHFPTEDGPAHLYWAQVYQSLQGPASPWRSLYERNTHWNVPYLLYLGVDRVLLGFLEPHQAQQGVITLLLLAWITATWYLSVTVNNGITIGALAGLLLLHNSFLYSGYLSFLIGIPALIVAAAVLHRVVSRWEAGSRPPVGGYVLLAAVGVVVYYSHLVIAVLFVGIVFLAAAAYWHRFPSRAAALATTAVPTLVLMATYLRGDSFGGGGIEWPSVWYLATRFVGLPFWRGFASPTPAFWVSLALVGLLFATLVFGAARSYVRGEVVGSQRISLLVGAALLALFFVVPESIGRSGDAVNRRVQIAAWAVLLPILPGQFSERTRATLLGGTLLLLSWQLVDFTTKVWRFNTAYAAILARAANIPPGSVIRSVQRYEDSGFEHSFMQVLAEFQADVALHCGCVLVQAHAPSTPHYWVRVLPGAQARVDLELDIERPPRAGTEPSGVRADRAGAAEHGPLSLVIRTSGRRLDVLHPALAGPIAGRRAPRDTLHAAAR